MSCRHVSIQDIHVVSITDLFGSIDLHHLLELSGVSVSAEGAGEGGRVKLLALGSLNALSALRLESLESLEVLSTAGSLSSESRSGIGTEGRRVELGCISTGC